MNSDKIQTIFFSQDNFNILHQLIKENIYSTYGKNVNIESIDFERTSREKISQLMTQLYYENEGKDLKSLNKIVLTNAIPKIKSLVTQFVSQPPQATLHPKDNIRYQNEQMVPSSRAANEMTGNNGGSGNRPRDLDINHRQPPSFVDMRAPSQEFNINKKEITANYERLSKERQNVDVAPASAPQFKLSLETDNMDIMSKFEQMKKRQNEELATTVNTPISQQPSQSIPPSSSSNLQQFANSLETFENASKEKNWEKNKGLSVYQDNLKSRDDVFKNNIGLVIQEKNEDTNKWASSVSHSDELNMATSRNLQDEIFRKNTTTMNRDILENIVVQENVKMVEQLNEYQKKKSQQADFLIERAGTYTTEQYYLEISSGDRDFSKPTTSENRFDFSINFDSEGNSYVSYPIFENNPTLPATEQQSNMGQKGDTNPSYDASQPLGKTVGYERIRTFTSVNAGVPFTVKNIVDIKLNYIIVYYPHDSTYNYFNYINNNPEFNYSFLLLQTPELMQNYRSTNENINNSFSKLIVDKSWLYLNQNFGTLLYRPVNDEHFTYRVPLANFNRLSFKINTPDGKLLSTENDWSQLQSITFNANTNEITLRLSKYALKSVYPIGHVIQLKNLEVYNTAFTSSSIADKMTGFLTNSTHKIKSLARTDTSSPTDTQQLFINEITIDSLSTMNDLTGEIDYENISTIAGTEYNSYAILVNTSIQTQISFTVTSKKDDITTIQTLIV